MHSSVNGDEGRGGGEVHEPAAERPADSGEGESPNPKLFCRKYSISAGSNPSKPAYDPHAADGRAESLQGN
jgi:hypothetical protein